MVALISSGGSQCPVLVFGVLVTVDDDYLDILFY